MIEQKNKPDWKIYINREGLVPMDESMSLEV